MAADAEDLFKKMAKKWPSEILARQSVAKFTGGLISARYMANLDSQGKGPNGKMTIGRKVVYPVNEFLKWLQSRIR